MRDETYQLSSWLQAKLTSKPVFLWRHSALLAKNASWSNSVMRIGGARPVHSLCCVILRGLGASDWPQEIWLRRPTHFRWALSQDGKNDLSLLTQGRWSRVLWEALRRELTLKLIDYWNLMGIATGKEKMEWIFEGCWCWRMIFRIAKDERMESKLSIRQMLNTSGSSHVMHSYLIFRVALVTQSKIIIQVCWNKEKEISFCNEISMIQIFLDTQLFVNKSIVSVICN